MKIGQCVIWLQLKCLLLTDHPISYWPDSEIYLMARRLKTRLIQNYFLHIQTSAVF